MPGRCNVPSIHMARVWFNGDAPALALEYAAEWRRKCWDHEGSILSNANLWSHENAQELREHFVNQPIEGSDLSFFEKLEKQLSLASSGAKKLAAEMLWLLYLFPLDTKGSTKREHIQRVWEWSGEPLDLSSPWLGSALDTGIGAANPGLSNYKPAEVALIVVATCAWRAMSAQDRDAKGHSWAFGNWLDSMPESKGRQFRHIWMYLLFPDECEPSSSETHKQRIAKHYKETPGVADELKAIEQPSDSDRVRADKLLLAIRRTLEKKQGAFCFYTPAMRSEWSPAVAPPNTPPHVPPKSKQLPALEVADNLASIDLGDLFIEEDDFSDIFRKLKREKNLILQGPPGVGKTFVAKKLAENLAGSPERVRWIQFHESYSYEDFIRGYRPDGNGGFRLEDGAFHLFNDAAQKSEQPFVLVIDEINRGKLSKIFGELLMCIECDKRGPKWAVQLPYRKAPDEQPFYVAPNLYVIGLMNTADRSLAVVDYALRRRFSFHTLRPMFSTQRFKKFLLDKEMLPELMEKVLDRLIALNKTIEAELGPGFAIGHSFFCPSPGDELDENWYLDVVRSHIEPLLEEYWFDNRTRVNELMGDLALQ